MKPTIVRCACSREKLAEINRDGSGDWRVSTFPNILAARVKDAFRQHGDEHVQFQLEAIRRCRDDVIDLSTSYRLECGRCVRVADVSGSELVRIASERPSANYKLAISEMGHVEEIPDQPPAEGRVASIQFSQPDDER